MRDSRKRQENTSLPPVTTLSLRDGNKWFTAIAVALLLIVGLFFLGRGVNLALTRQGGWTEIQTRTGAPGCAGEFRFQYLLDDRNGNAEYRALSTLYTDACQREAEIYSAEPGGELGNLGALNAAPNETVTLEPELYRALEKIRDSGDRVLYLAPLYEDYSCLFFCEEDEETLVYDPLRNPELAQTFGTLAAFASDPEQIDLELLGDNRACLHVSEAYRSYAAENGITRFVDFGWMKNAFILDDLAEVIRAEGFHRGYIQSLDGFGCNLCDTGEIFGLNVLDRAYGGNCVAAQMTYSRPISFLSLHSYTTAPARNDLYYELADGQVRSIYVDPADGMPKTAMDDLLLWSDKLGCGDLVLRGQRVFVRDRLEPGVIQTLDCFYAYCEEGVLFCSDPAVDFPVLAEGYTLQRAG